VAKTQPVSVVIPHYESPLTLGRTVRSILSQTVLPAEIIIVDDASSAVSRRAAEKIASSTSAVECRFEALDVNSGPGAARNVGWDLARQPILAFIDADDSWSPQKIELQTPLLLGPDHLDAVGHPMMVVSLDSAALVGSSIVSDEVSYTRLPQRQWLSRNRFAMSGVMLRRDLPFRFRADVRHSEDYELWLRMAFAGHRMALMSEPLGTHHKAKFGDSGLSAQLWAMERGELLALRSLCRSGSISTAALGATATFSFAKYVRRVLQVSSRRYC
jgi:glycosyltransferase involved in cell wall biosynthesis